MDAPAPPAPAAPPSHSQAKQESKKQHHPADSSTKNQCDSTSSATDAEFEVVEDKAESFDVKKQRVLKKNLEKMNRRLRSVFKFSRSYYAQYMRYRFLKLRWINNCVVNFM